MEWYWRTNIMTHYELLLIILQKLGHNKKVYLSKKMGYHPRQVSKWMARKENLRLTFRAIFALCKVANELGIILNKDDLFN